MAWLWAEGFDNLYQPADLTNNTGFAQWSTVNFCTLPTGRGGIGKALSFGNAIVSFGVNQTECYLGFAIKAAANPTFNFIDATTNTYQATLTLDTIYGITKLYGGNSSALLYATGNNSTNLGTYGFLEIHLKTHATAGIFEVQYNGNTIASISGVKTAYSANNYFNAVFFGAGNGSAVVDDMRLFDTTTGAGTYPCNSWGGDLRVASIYPSSNSSVTWTPSGSNNWSDINNQGTQSLGTTYNTTSTVGNEDLFNLQTLSSVISEIIGVQIKGAYQETDAAAHTLEQLLHISGTDYPGAAKTLSQGWQYFTDIYPINPATGVSWVLTDVNSLIAGYKALS
jgi:hypothetical protein